MISPVKLIVTYTVTSPSDKMYKLPSVSVWPRPPVRVNELRLRTRLRILAGWPLAVAMKVLRGSMPPAAGRRA